MTFISLILASQFGSFLQPLAIMAWLPLLLIGVFIALLVFKSTPNIFSVTGLIMLMGLVTKSAILLVDSRRGGRCTYCDAWGRRAARRFAHQPASAGAPAEPVVASREND